MSQVFYLGPAGTFTHDASRLYFADRLGSAFEPCVSPSSVMRQLVSAGEGHGVVPIENSVQGEVIPTLDALCFEFSDVFVTGEVCLPITFGLFASSVDAKPRVVLSHPHALAQCQRLIAMRGLREQAVASTAEACRIVAERGDPELCAVASHSAGERFGLSTVDSAVEDFVGAVTRFLVVENSMAFDPEADRTLLALLPPSTGTGVLADFSGAFADAGVNIFGLHVRPLRAAMGQYLFIATLSGSPTHGATRAAIDALLSRAYGVKLLGAYVAWEGLQPAALWPAVPGLLGSERFERTLPALERP